ncbi:uncharacterized protein DS421_10g306130 [Arachis hypogaea]|nr:uncharacterized protein DS421_10g306130 [Arachis hypogaea]
MRGRRSHPLQIFCFSDRLGNPSYGAATELRSFISAPSSVFTPRPRCVQVFPELPAQAASHRHGSWRRAPVPLLSELPLIVGQSRRWSLFLLACPHKTEVPATLSRVASTLSQWIPAALLSPPLPLDGCEPVELLILQWMILSLWKLMVGM